MGGCEIPLTDPSVAPRAPNIPFVTIAFRDHLRSGGRTADADPPRAIMLFAYGVQCLVGRQAAIQAAPGSITSKRRSRTLSVVPIIRAPGTDHMTDVPDIPAGRFGSSPPCSRWTAGEVGPCDHGSAMDHRKPVTTCHLPGRETERSHERKGSFVIMGARRES